MPLLRTKSKVSNIKKGINLFENEIICILFMYSSIFKNKLIDKTNPILYVKINKI